MLSSHARDLKEQRETRTKIRRAVQAGHLPFTKKEEADIDDMPFDELLDKAIKHHQDDE